MNDNFENSNRPPIAQLIVLTAAISSVAAILLQNLQPLVKVYFLGQSTIPIPLSLTMLAAFLSGALAAAIVNSIANALDRRNFAIPDTNAASTASRTKDTGVKDDTQKTTRQSIQDDDDSYTTYPRSGSKTTIQDEDEDDDDDNRDEIYVKYIRR
jgi:uncharacterized integral membrane protein